MSEFQFVCPFCDTSLDCPEELNGVETECPVCNEIIVPVSADAINDENLIQKEVVIQDRESLKEKILNNVKKIKINSVQLVCILMVLFFLIPFGVTSCIISCAEKARNIHNESYTPSSPVIHYSDQEKKEMKEAYLMLKEAQKRLEKRKKERTIEKLVDIMDSWD